MGILVFIIVLVVLIVVHELGHFIVAKLAGMRVDEFGLGYPPRAATIATKGETSYTLNWLPFGGFVRIYGEDGGMVAARAFGSRPRVLQALVLVAGVAMNMLFAYVLISGALVVGTPRALSGAELARATDVSLGVSGVLPGSPADVAGIVPGDLIISAQDPQGKWAAQDSPAGFTAYIEASAGDPIEFAVLHAEQEEARTIVAAKDVVPGAPERYALGVEVAPVGILPMALPAALVEGARLTWRATVLTAEGLWHFFYTILTGHADFSQVTGPVGIAGVVGGASHAGIAQLTSLVAIISINLALINLLPVPALDGGRLLFVLIEGMIRRPLSPAVTRVANSVSFALLILLMLAVTAHDIYRLAA